MPPNNVICLGECGVTTDDQGRLITDLPSWPFPCLPGSPATEPIGCNSAGQLIAPPRQQVLNTFFSENTPGFVWDAGGSSASPVCHTFTITINNPDTCRRMRGIGIWTLRPIVEISEHDQVRIIGDGDIAHEFRNDNDIGHTLTHEFQRFSRLEIPPGGSQALSMGVCVVTTSGGTALTHEIRAQLQLMAVSETIT